MTNQLAAEQCQATADFLSQMVRQGHIPKHQKAEACDHAINMNLLAKAHCEAAMAEPAEPVAIA